jgi:hypothetical protein
MIGRENSTIIYYGVKYPPLTPKLQDTLKHNFNKDFNNFS